MMATDSRQVRRAAARAARGRLPPRKGPRLPLKWQDAITLLALVVALAGMLSENNTVVAACLVACWVILCLPVIWHPEIPKEYRLSWCVLSVLIWYGIFFLIQSQNLAKELSRNEGTLEPSNDVVTEKCPMPHKDAFELKIGPSAFFVGSYNKTVFNIAGQNIFALTEQKVGSIKISLLRVYDDRNNIIVRIDENSFWVDAGVRKKRPDKSTLKIYDHNDDEVLNMRFHNKHVVSILGVFRYLGRIIKITPDLIQAGQPPGGMVRDHGSCSVDSPATVFKLD
jgi:hypothetical protein